MSEEIQKQLESVVLINQEIQEGECKQANEAFVRDMQGE